MNIALRRAWSCLLPAALVLFFASITRAANMSPVAVTGFNWDVVVENTSSGPNFTTASELNPGEGKAFYQAGLSGYSYGLAVSGGFTSAVCDGSAFQFQAYIDPNAL